MASSTPVTVTVCGVYQSDWVNVSASLTVAAPELVVGVTVTSTVGWLLSTTV